MCGFCGRWFEQGQLVHMPGGVMEDELVCDWCIGDIIPEDSGTWDTYGEMA